MFLNNNSNHKKEKKMKPESSLGQPNRIEKSTKIKGDITSEADFRIDGQLEGNVITSGKIIIGNSGRFLGKVECVNAEIEGYFSGELYVSGLLSIKSSGIIDGDVIVSKLSVEPGATFNASCSMQGKIGASKTRVDESEKRTIKAK